MWFKLATANFTDKNLGKMADIAGSWGVSYSLQGNITKNSCPTTVKMNDGKTQAEADFTATFTLGDGATLTSITATLKSSGATLVTETSNPSITIPAASITGDIVITAIASGTSSGGGSEGDDDTTTPVGVDKVLLSNYRSETGTTLNSGTYGTLAKDTHVTFFDIPINPSEVYYVSWGVRAWFLKSDKSPISTINFYSASDVGKAHYVMAPSNAAYMSVCISNTLEGYSLPDAYIQQASLSFTATSSQLVSATAGVSAMQDNKGLNSASYIVEDKDGSWVYEYIPIVAGQSYRIEGGVRSWFLNSSKTSISTVNLTQNLPKFTFTAPADAAYISVTFSSKQWTGEKDAVKIEEGTIDYTLK